ncbi:phenylalanine--tRNA ligase subunit alpha [Oceanidesulfovibrio marinus]|uniref:Phenylalanine--tRNA ligase alpha subunit n=1 Tax=Oceanidesulfovibrio marinus TaxID=370038 RepID=A0A6P1ZLH5_9BACT|nr:phenylalanine--tRNA ligase subunit alpha [Oceanidesulfovibrio marinus]TVM35959.1 phenylalanine--tRNA ligase subunit alpha [Oceanidesulfovibrio marinus]
MPLSDLISELEALVPAMRDAMENAGDEKELETVRVEFLGRKGSLAAIMSRLPELDPAERPEAGKAANRVKTALTEIHEDRLASFARSRAEAELEGFDPTLPGRDPACGTLHPITLVMEEVCAVFAELGFEVVTGPEVENDYYNFEALNMPADHPARDMQDTLYVSDNIVLRTHTSPMQARVMEKREPPVAVIAPGKVYRRDSDVTHTPMFHQIEGLLVDKGVSMADLRSTLTYFVRKVFAKDAQLRFRPSFFPFTEPSAEVDISCVMCGGKGHVHGQTCRICKQTGWVEILGCGMVDPEVFKFAGYDSEKWTGWAFGMGLERIALLKYGVGDIRLNFENDLRYLRQFY